MLEVLVNPSSLGSRRGTVPGLNLLSNLEGRYHELIQHEQREKTYAQST